MAMKSEKFLVSFMIGTAALHSSTLMIEQNGGSNITIRPIASEGGGADIGGSKEGKVSARTVMLGWLPHNPEFRTNEAIAYADEHGIGAGATYTMIATFMREGVLKRIGAGRYRVTKKLAKAAKQGTGTKGSKAKAKQHKQKFEPIHSDFILQKLKVNGGTRTYRDLKADFGADDRPTKSVDGAIAKLKEKKLLLVNGPGDYQLSVRGKDAASNIGKES